MLRYLRTLARSHLIPRPGVTEIEESTDLSALDAVIHYRWLTLTLPEDLLLAALDVDPAPQRVEIDPPLLVRRLLDLGVAEIHQHVGAGMNFPLLWASALAALASPDIKADALASPGAPLSDGVDLVRWLLAAAVVRSALAEHLIRRRGTLKDFLDELLGLDATAADERRGDGAIPLTSAWTPRRRETLLGALRALVSGDEKRLPKLPPLRDLYADIHPTALTLRDQPIGSVEDAFRRCDPIAVRLNLHGENVGERWFLRQALGYLTAQQDEQSRDSLFTRVFWQVVRIRCQYYRAVVERPLTGGLQWFLRFYGRLGDFRKPLDPIRPEVSYHVAGEGHRIRALELRTSAGDTPVQIAEDLLDFARSWRRVLEKSGVGSQFEPEIGVVYHFIKGRDEADTWLKGVPPAFWAGTHAEPFKGGSDVEHGRYVGYYAKQCRKALALGELIRKVPSCLWLLRGLDVANDEIGIPTWVLAPLFRHVVVEAARVSILKGAGPPLRLTAHVGEDFRHLLEGLRRVYEQVHYILGGGTGRLGHAIALGVDPQSWAESVGSVLMPAEERLWDLVWEWRLYSKYHIRPEYAAPAPPGRVDALLNQVRDLSHQVFGAPGYRVQELAEAHHLLHRFLVPPYQAAPAVDGGYRTFFNAARNIRRRRFFEDGPDSVKIQSPLKVGRLLEDYLGDEAVFRRGQKLIDVPICRDEVAALTAVQYALRRGIGQNGIVIEVNPSSNLLIGDLLDLRNHPILRLFPPLPEEGGPPPVAIALGSDDPLTFSTQLLREYTLLHQAACAAGYPERAVQDWLESIRRTGMDARFTKAWRPNALKQADRLIRDLRGYLHEPDA